MDDISSISTPPASRRRTLALCLALAFVAAACSHGDAKAGTKLPEANLTELATGKAASWDAGDKPMVLNFWASWCTPCRAEMPAFEEVSKELGDQVAIVGVTDEDDLTAAKKAADKAGVTYPLLVDVDQTLLTDVGITGLPGTVFVDADGTIVGRHLGALTADELTKEIEDRYGITS